MRTGVPGNENRFFPVAIDSQGVPCELYRVWVCSVGHFKADGGNFKVIGHATRILGRE